MTEELYHLDDGVYRVVDRGPAMIYRPVKKGKRVTSEQQIGGTWVHLEKIGPPVHDRGSPPSGAADEPTEWR